MLRPVTRRTLFPYTTLFRSKAQSPVREVQVVDNLRSEKSTDVRAGRGLKPRGELLRRDGADVCGLLDRKSTRLNSSHITISYAVFCLKKKNKRTITSRRY